MAVDKVLHCGLVNIQSVGNKTINIRNLINEAKFDIFMLTETWLWGNVSDSSKIKEMTLKTHTFYHFPIYSIYIPWPFPPVWGVADNTKETTKTRNNIFLE